MKEMFCAVCGQGASYKVLYPQNFEQNEIDEKVFSARRMPDRKHYRIVECDQCGLIYSTPVLGESELSRLYEESEFTYGEEAANIGDVYQRSLKHALKSDFDGKRLLEIGCGNGFFLERAQDNGCAEVRGIEPSFDAVAAANEDIRANIVTGFFGPGVFEENYFDVVCSFQVLDHVPDPNVFVEECFRVLKPGGILLFITHNTRALSARLLGPRSPIFDVEHIYLFDPKTISALLAKHGAHTVKTRSIVSRYALSYWVWLIPMPNAIKKGLLKVLNVTRIGRIRVPLKAGNMEAIGVKPKIETKKEREHD
jgi:2-polyprenyl-3-methyl-5-hydroxy-6-metoxy-1,4-benzoquinol methylase